MEAFLGVIIGVLSSLGVVTYFRSRRRNQRINSQSIILLDKIKSVCKFITVEGDFAEIYHYEDVKEKFLKLINSKKKALVVVNAKAHIGYDLAKINLRADKENKKIFLEHFPQPEILSIETDLNYYDKSDGYFNKFEASDLTELHQDAKKHIEDKIPESGLIQAAQKEALQTISLIENIVETIGWNLDYSALVLEEKPKRLIE